MREIIEEILGAEKEAEGLVSQAQQKASEIRSRSDAESAAILGKAREDAQALLKAESERARDDARRSREALLRAAEEENARFQKQHVQTIGRLVDRVVDLVLTPEQRKG